MPPRKRKAQYKQELFKELIQDTDYKGVYRIPKNINLNKKKYLSFDVATKTISFCILEIPEDINSYLHTFTLKYNKLTNDLQNADDNTIDTIANDIAKLKDDIRDTIKIIHGSVDTLIPEKKDKEISEIERIRAIVDYSNNIIRPLIKDYQPDELTVLIEHQMAPNFKARAVQNSLVALLADYTNIHIVKPIYKNRINLDDEHHWINFVKKYKTRYTANKKHAITNFELLSKHFTCDTGVTKKFVSHISDAFMQTLAFYKFNLHRIC
jgi:hypothetical protein